jgi:hypothetical protein
MNARLCIIDNEIPFTYYLFYYFVALVLRFLIQISLNGIIEKVGVRKEIPMMLPQVNESFIYLFVGFRLFDELIFLSLEYYRIV